MGRLVYLMGASGSGKDSLLDALRHALPAGLVVAHRYITRPANAGAENHIALRDDEFNQRLEQGLFALDWQAHSCRYSVGIEIDHWMAQGCNVVVNGSRAHLDQAMQRYGQRLLPVCLQVSESVLEQRLRQRGREDREQIRHRLLRAAQYASGLPAHCQRLDNDGPLHETLAAFLHLLNQPVSAKNYDITSQKVSYE
ncbi:ribose 1,5-bisphosphokinase [Enterobacterales bacterium]|nr:ribose 1,5-bisphosphokinase [Enterobacterales bacterium]